LFPPLARLRLLSSGFPETMASRVLLVLSLLVWRAAPAFPQDIPPLPPLELVAQSPASSPVKVVISLERALADALLARDREAIEQLVGDRFVLRGTPDVAREAWITQALAACRGTVLEVVEPAGQAFGTVVVASFDLASDTDLASCKPAESRSAITDVWVRTDNAWRLMVRHPGPVRSRATPPPPLPAAPAHSWDLKGELSFVATGGNSSTQTLGAATDLTHRTPRATTRVTSSFLTSEAESVTNARSFGVQLRHGFRSGPRLELFGRLGYNRDRFAGIEHRSIAEAGAAFTPAVPPRHSLAIEASAGYTAEQRLASPDLHFATATGAIKYAWRISSGVVLTDDLAVVSDLEVGRNWRATNLVAVSVALTRRFSLKTSNAIEYRNLAVPGFERTDLRTSAALVFAFQGH
jgi:putative salt-induced outer membrane protein